MARRARPKQNGRKYALTPLPCKCDDCEEDFFVSGPTHKRVCAAHFFNPPQPSKKMDPLIAAILAMNK
jgi:hypothetical protein